MIQSELLEKIDRLSTKYRESIIQPDGSLGIKTEFNKYLFLNNFSEFELIQDFEIVCELPLFLIRTSIFPRENCFQNQDHRFFLNWTSKILQNLIRPPLYKDKHDRHYLNLLINLLYDFQEDRFTGYITWSHIL